MNDEIKEMVGGSALILINAAIVLVVASGMPFGLVGNWFAGYAIFLVVGSLALLVEILEMRVGDD